ncbi:SufE family protein [Microbacterium sp.]|uniref:SufE family protein n=1 Tax=Microbacterium sp. TaxID=51671 RepID=UPI003A88D958
MPSAFAAIIDDFQDLDESERLELLLDFAGTLPDLPARFADAPEKLEAVEECQAPVFLAVEVGDEGAPAGPDAPVALFVSAPPEAPTTRGFASILVAGLAGLTAQQVLDVPDDVSQRLGLARAVSPLRLRGLAGMLRRIKRQVSEQARPAG